MGSGQSAGPGFFSFGTSITGRLRPSHRWAALVLFLLLVATSGSVALAQSAFACYTSSNIYRVNLQTGASTPVGNNGNFLEGLAFDTATGRLFGTDSGGGLHEIN